MQEDEGEHEREDDAQLIMPHDMTSTTAVRMAVARWDGTPSMPSFARMDVSAANTAESDANKTHILLFLPPSTTKKACF